MAKLRTRKCAARHCQRQVASWLHFCVGCYKTIPGWLKKDLGDEYQYMKKHGLHNTQRQAELVRQAIDLIEAVLKKKLEKSRAVGGDLAAI